MRKFKKPRWTIFELFYQLKKGGEWKTFRTRVYYRTDAEKEFREKAGIDLKDAYDSVWLRP